MENAQGWRKVRTEAELREAVARQVGHLRESAKRFDEGRLEEAERLAAAVYIICYDGGKNSRSALTHLNLKAKMRIPETTSVHIKAFKARGVNFMGPPLCGFWKEAAGITRYTPLLGDPKEMDWVAFSKWWEHKVYVTRQKLMLSRKNIVYFMRSQDGGAHLDKKITGEAYNSLTEATDFVQSSGSDEIHLYTRLGSAPLPGAHWATMRQIAWELEHGLTKLGF